MSHPASVRWWSWSPPVVFVAATGVSAAVAQGPAAAVAPLTLLSTTAMLLPALCLGALLAVRVPANPVGGALGWTAATPAAVFAAEWWVEAHPAWPEALRTALWPWLLLGFVALVLVFPDGPLPGAGWWAVAVLAPVSAALLTTSLVLVPEVAPTTVAAFVLFLGVLVATAASQVVRFRRGDDLTRARLRWLMLAAGAVPVLLAAGWGALSAGVAVEVAFGPFLVAMLVMVPAAVAVAILRHDLFDVDRLLGAGLAVVLTAVVSAGVFATVVVAAGEVLGRESRLGVTGAAFVTALCLLPLHRALTAAVGRLVDRERHVMVVRLRAFARAVRDGSAQPEQVEEELRAVLDDPALRLLLRRPGTVGHVDLHGGPAEVAPGAPQVLLRTGDAEVGVLQLGALSARRLRRAREAAVEARLPIEVSRLRMELRDALDEVRASRARLAAAAGEERRRLERDLHDGAQQQIVAVGMRLRSVQRRLDRRDPAYAELDRAVESLEATVAELRGLAHGVRPARLDDGLAAALHSLVGGGPVPVRLAVHGDADALPELVATTAYYVVAEALANAFKHSGAGRVEVRVERAAGELRVEVRDDGTGGAVAGFGLTSLRDRVASADGELHVHSPVGEGTVVRAGLPCVS